MKAIHFSRILCPVTFSDDSQRIVEGAAVLAAMHDAELRLFHVLPPDSDGDRDAETLVASLFALSSRLPERLRISAAIACGDPSSEITQHARVMRADLIVLGANPRATPEDFADTITGKVASRPPCPVFVIRPRQAAALADGGRGFAEILCCADFLTSSPEGAGYVQAMTHSGHARVTLLNVLTEDNDEPAPADENTNFVDDGMHIVHVVLTGSAGPEIVALARRVGSDLVVVGAGSTATQVMAGAPCSVLIVPAASRMSQVSPFADYALYR